MKHVKDWPVILRVVEEDGRTRARLTITADSRSFEAGGEAHRSPLDEDVPAAGDELAVGRALIELGNRMVRAARSDIEQADVERVPPSA
jgi:hypothetical protein